MSSQPLSFIPDQQADWRMDSALGIEIETHSGMKREPLTGSTLEVRNGFYILHLWGKPYERGRAHGKLLREKIRESRITRYYGSFLLNLYRSSDFIRKVPGFIKDLLGDLLEWWFSAWRRCLWDAGMKVARNRLGAVLVRWGVGINKKRK